VTTAVEERIEEMFEGQQHKNGLSERAMTVSLHLSAWRGQRIDRDLTREVLAERQAASDAGRFEKYLVPPKALEPVNKAHTQARQRHYRLTLPWGDENVRILASAAFFEYNNAMSEERSNCERTYDDFCASYPRYLAEAPARLVKLFDPKDFPSPTEIASKFGFSIQILPVPDKADFRVTLGGEIEDEIRENIERTVTDRLALAQQDLWARVLDTVKHFAQTMREDDKVFRDTTVTKLADLARLAPKLSLSADPRLEEICADVLAIADGLDPDDLRKNKRIRSEAADQAQAALAKIESAMAGAF
jgi:hypothetical protein